ncbi:MAG: hypothetical protein HOW97_08275 [Catenulispora sp.]|nr:hypothetical protein [Catenulispora sp.]
MTTILVILMVLVVIGLAVVLITGAVKANRLERAAARGPQVSDYRERLTDEDREYLEESWRHVAGIFPQSPETALDMAHHTVASVLHARGVDSARIPAEPEDNSSASPEELRRRLVRYEHIVADLTGAAPRL